MIPNWINKKTIAWSLYDFADTAFSALFITFFFPILIKVHLGGNEFQIGLAMGISILIAAFLVPFIGAVSDVTGRRMPIIIITAVLTAILTVLTGYSLLTFALLFGFLANITHLISKDVYDAKMSEIVSPKLYGSLSGLGVGVGYLGTIASLAVGYVLLSFFGWESLAGIQTIFWEVAVFYPLFSLPLFLLVPDLVQKSRTKLHPALAAGLASIKQTIKTLPSFPAFFYFLISSFFYNNGMNTVIVFLALYAREVIDLGTREFFPVFGVMALSAAAGSFLAGRFSDKFGPVLMIKKTLYLWIAIIILLLLNISYPVFVVAGILGGAALGAIWTFNRHMIAAISPKEKIAELFGFEGLTEKFSGVIGPVVFGLIVYWAGPGNEVIGYQNALLSMLIFFAIGLWFLRKIPRNG